MIIKVVPYQTEWPSKFRKEAFLLHNLIGDNLLKAHHIGSTSVPQLMAKPIIDILLEVKDLELLDQKNPDFIRQGYEPKGAYGIAGRRYFRKGSENRSHHVHAFVAGDPNVERHLAFRDYLRMHPDVAKAYGELKFANAAKSNKGLLDYCDAKDPFIKLHEQKALAWYQK